MCNQGEKVIGVTGRDKRVCVSCVASYSLCVPPLPLDSGGGGRCSILPCFGCFLPKRGRDGLSLP